MGENRNNLASVSFYNLETGEKVHEFETTPLTVSQNLSADAEPSYRIDGSLSFALDDYESQELWKNFIVNNPLNTTVEFDGYAPNGLVQARTHKRKRINKKWLKRYGVQLGYKKVHGKMLECRAENFPDRVELSSSSITLK
jgi:hypothetical protein